MAVGMAAALANSTLDTQLPNTSYFQLHTGDPGASGTANVSTTVTARVVGTWAAASGGSKSLSSNSVFAAASGSETITHVSVWTTITTGTFKESLALTTSKSLTTGDIFSLSTYTRSITPLAA